MKMGSSDVIRDFEENHGLKIEDSYIQNISYRVGKLYIKMEDKIEYKLPQIDEEIVTVGIGMDGTCSYVGNNGWRETMVGTISLYDKDSNRLHTIYLSEAPEYGKVRFKEIFTKEINSILKIVPSSAKIVGIADGAKDNWNFLETFVETQIIDFYHASEYLAYASKVVNLRDKKEQKEWLDSACHRLKNGEKSALI
ncbi:MAG: ISKra4 family transposase, partial [Sulfurovaceae bacterium]|nr:ISKra4 family transposase [Sulfurovaceae bacterium]